ncbi:MAG: hypothetical protein AAGF12_25520 [Myxococcota bacterium]
MEPCIPTGGTAPESHFTARLLGAAPSSAGERVARAITTIALAAVYGLALGARDGGAALLSHAVGVPSAALAIAILGLPALYIVLSLSAAPVTLRQLVDAAAGAFAHAAMILAGLAPAVALFVTTSETATGALVAGVAGLGFGGAVGLRYFLLQLSGALRDATTQVKLVGVGATLVFSIFSVALASRVWVSTLSILGGVS